MANVYAPLYNSLQARGRMAPIGVPGAIRPQDKGKSLGEKAAGALGAMISEGLKPAKAPSTQERLARAKKRDKELRRELQNKKSIETPKKVMQAPYVQVGTDANGKKIFGFPEEDKYKILTQPLGQATPGPSLLEEEWMANYALIQNLEGESGKKNERVFQDFVDRDKDSLTYGKTISDARRVANPTMGGELIYSNYSHPSYVNSAGQEFSRFDDFTQPINTKPNPIGDFISNLSRLNLK